VVTSITESLSIVTVKRSAEPAGLTTSATMAGVEERAIMQQTRHRSVMVARRYIRDGSLFQENAAAAVGV
jgi:hypothetical protein